MGGAAVTTTLCLKVIVLSAWVVGTGPSGSRFHEDRKTTASSFARTNIVIIKVVSGRVDHWFWS